MSLAYRDTDGVIGNPAWLMAKKHKPNPGRIWLSQCRTPQYLLICTHVWCKKTSRNIIAGKSALCSMTSSHDKNEEGSGGTPSRTTYISAYSLFLSMCPPRYNSTFSLSILSHKATIPQFLFGYNSFLPLRLRRNSEYTSLLTQHPGLV
jgi:hypothetical protein